ncbi:MAG: SigB/SigF/SigG family RNA polymerase sigma factor [Clostridiales bacterium]|nr:SigB/SigF/SigG family RNA polymerase sigma factor [Clostridiales bacterium]
MEAMASERMYIASDKEDVYALIRLAKEGDPRARELLVTGNTGLVKSIALKFINTGHELDDLLQIGFIGLLKAVDRFDPSFGVMFSTYAVPMIIGEIKRYLRDDGRVKMSRSTKEKVRELRRFREEFTKKESRSPHISELAEGLSLSAEGILELLSAEEALWNPSSLDDPDRVEGPAGDHKEEEQLQVDRIQLKGALVQLEQRERQVIVLRYFRDLTQQQIADMLGISQVQVSRIEKRVLLKLRKEMAEEPSVIGL